MNVVEEQQQQQRLGGESPVEEKARIHAALQKFAGDRIQAAAELGMTHQDLKNRIYESPDLKLRWMPKAEGKVPDDIDAMLMEKPLTVMQERLAKVVEADDAKLEHGLNDLPLTPEERANGLALQRFNRDNFASQLGIINSSITTFNIKLMTIIGKRMLRLDVVQDTLLSYGNEQNEDRGFWVDEEDKIVNQIINLGHLLRQLQTSSFEGNKTLALIRYKLKNGNKDKKIKPGFTDIGIGVEVEEDQPA